jgi:hypothetical protein
LRSGIASTSSGDGTLEAQVAPHQIGIGADYQDCGGQLAAGDAENAAPSIQLIGFANVDGLNDMTIPY